MGLTLSRRFLILSLAGVPSVARAACAPTRVLFVCPAGTVKSAIAREMLRARIDSQRLNLAVTSRGLHPENHVSEALAARLKADRLDTDSEPARPVTARDVAGADIVIAFDEAAASPLLGKARAWRTPSWNADYDAAKADLALRLDALVTELRGRREGCR